MTKNQVIEAVLKSHVPEATALSMATYLQNITRNLPENPNPRLFQVLHGAILVVHQNTITDTVVDTVADSVTREHRATIGKLREISTELGIRYQESEDPLLA